MRLQSEIDKRAAESRVQYLDRCPDCAGLKLACPCHERYAMAMKKYETGIPYDFWDYTEADVTLNRVPFDGVVKPYMDRLHLAFRGGYGLLFLGDNGVGKSMFLNLVLQRVLERGFTAYYTTLLDLDHNVKRAFDDRKMADRLEMFLLTSDFLALDEFGKERFKKGDSYMRTQVERVLKKRFEESMPTLIATNAELHELEGLYGATLSSVLQGKYQNVEMEAGDYRRQLGARMRREMTAR